MNGCVNSANRDSRGRPYVTATQHSASHTPAAVTPTVDATSNDGRYALPPTLIPLIIPTTNRHTISWMSILASAKNRSRRRLAFLVRSMFGRRMSPASFEYILQPNPRYAQRVKPNNISCSSAHTHATVIDTVSRPADSDVLYTTSCARLRPPLAIDTSSWYAFSCQKASTTMQRNMTDDTNSRIRSW